MSTKYHLLTPLYCENLLYFKIIALLVAFRLGFINDIGLEPRARDTRLVNESSDHLMVT